MASIEMAVNMGWLLRSVQSFQLFWVEDAKSWHEIQTPGLPLFARQTFEHLSCTIPFHCLFNEIGGTLSPRNHLYINLPAHRFNGL
jgi:hypothetical protein